MCVIAPQNDEGGEQQVQMWECNVKALIELQVNKTRQGIQYSWTQDL